MVHLAQYLVSDIGQYQSFRGNVQHRTILENAGLSYPTFWQPELSGPLKHNVASLIILANSQ